MSLLDSVATLSGHLVTLRPVSREDYPTLFRWRSSFDTIHLLNFRRRVAHFEEFVRDIEGLLPNATLLLVHERSSGQPIGYVLAHSINPWDAWLAVGMYVEPGFRLRGHGGEAALLSLDALFRIYPLRRVLTEVYDFAETIVQMLRAMGFEERGHVPEHYFYEGRRWGMRLMVLDRDVWERRRDGFSDIVAVQAEYHDMPNTESLRVSRGDV